MAQSSISILENNYQWFLNQQEELIQKHPEGGFALVWNCELIGIWPTRNLAMTEGISQFGQVPFLIRSLQEEKTHQVNFSMNPIT
jgi:hypothetical protein